MKKEYDVWFDSQLLMVIREDNNKKAREVFNKCISITLKTRRRENE